MPKNSLTQGANYGDTQKLTDVKRASGTGGPLVQRTPAGRPTAGPMVPVTAVVEQPVQAEVLPEHQAMIDNYSRARAAYEKWAALASAADAGPRVLYYTAIAEQQMEEAARALKISTPDFLG